MNRSPTICGSPTVYSSVRIPPPPSPPRVLPKFFPPVVTNVYRHTADEPQLNRPPAVSCLFLTAKHRCFVLSWKPQLLFNLIGHLYAWELTYRITNLTPLSTEGRVWDMATEQSVVHTVECVLIAVHCSVTCYLKYVINGKSQCEWRVSLKCGKWTEWQNFLSHKLEQIEIQSWHWSVIAIAKDLWPCCTRDSDFDYMTTWATSCFMAKSWTRPW